MVPSILRGGEPRYLSLRWDFCYVVWFQEVVFSFSWSFFFLSIFSSMCKVSFLRAYWLFLDLVDLFLLSFVVFWFSLSVGHIFRCQIPSLYLDYFISCSYLRWTPINGKSVSVSIFFHISKGQRLNEFSPPTNVHFSWLFEIIPSTLTIIGITGPDRHIFTVMKGSWIITSLDYKVSTSGLDLYQNFWEFCVLFFRTDSFA